MREITIAHEYKDLNNPSKSVEVELSFATNVETKIVYEIHSKWRRDIFPKLERIWNDNIALSRNFVIYFWAFVLSKTNWEDVVMKPLVPYKNRSTQTKTNDNAYNGVMKFLQMKGHDKDHSIDIIEHYYETKFGRIVDESTMEICIKIQEDFPDFYEFLLDQRYISDEQGKRRK